MYTEGHDCVALCVQIYGDIASDAHSWHVVAWTLLIAVMTVKRSSRAFCCVYIIPFRTVSFFRVYRI